MAGFRGMRSNGAEYSLAREIGCFAAGGCLVCVAMMEHLHELMAWLEQINPAFLLPVIAILPLFGLPCSPFLVLLGYYYGPVEGMVIGLVAIAINDTLAYWLARVFLRGPILRLLERRKVKVPVVPEREQIRVVALVRITPGTPLFLQNYLLGMADIPFGRYLGVSVPVQAIHLSGFVIFGGAIFEGTTGTIVFAAFFLVALVLILRIVHSQMQARAADKPAT